jgi:hypothetical protein
MRKVLFASFFAIATATVAQAAQQLGDTRMHPVLNGCPAGMAPNAALTACIAIAPNGCCAPNPQRATCVNAAPGQSRWIGRPADLRSQAVICPR